MQNPFTGILTSGRTNKTVQTRTQQCEKVGEKQNTRTITYVQDLTKNMHSEPVTLTDQLTEQVWQNIVILTNITIYHASTSHFYPVSMLDMKTLLKGTVLRCVPEISQN